MHKKKFLVLLLFFLCYNQTTNAQIVASPSAGCAPLNVTFSGPSGATNIYWNLGLGVTSTSATASNLYISPGIYNVTYSAMVGGSPVNYNININVSAGPPANFSYILPSSHCAPMTVTFNATTSNSANANQWTFGDLTPIVSNTLQTTHTYVGQGSYIPLLVVVDAVTQCSTVVNSGTINVSAPPTNVIVSSAGVYGCSTPFNSIMSGSLCSANSPIPPNTLNSYNWNFGGGSPASSNAITPGLVTFPQGQHTVQLTLTDNNQCSNTTSMIITVANPSLAVSHASIICKDAPFLITFTTNMASADFNMGFGVQTFTDIPNVAKIATLSPYTTGGLKTFTVSIAPGGTCQPVVLTRTVFVEQVISTFSSLPLNGPHVFCQPSVVITYTNLSTTNSGASLIFTWEPIYSQVPQINSVNPVSLTTSGASTVTATFTLYQGSQNNPYSYYFIPFYPNIYLTAESNSSAGCKNVKDFAFDTIKRPKAYFSTTKKEGCSPLVVTFRDTSRTYNPLFALTGYTWCNGANPPVFVSGTLALPPPIPTIQPYTFTYATTGTYSPYLIIQTVNGCIDTSYVQKIVVANPPSIGNLTLTTNVVCVGTSVSASMAVSPSSLSINHWHLTSSNQMFSGCVSNPSPTYSFFTPGVFGFSVTAYQSGCPNTSAATQSITVKGPYGRFRVETNCTNKKTVSIDVNLMEVQTATLSFGDNTSTVVIGNAVGISTLTALHTYSASGDYTIRLFSVNAISLCAPHSYTQVVKIRQPRAVIDYNNQYMPSFANPVACTKSRYKFTANNSVDTYTDCCSGFLWSLNTPTGALPPCDVRYPMFAMNNPQPWIGGGPPEYSIFDVATKDTFRVVGTYTINLKVRDINGCADTTTRVFRISAAKPSFSLSANPLCLSNTLNIANGTYSNQIAPDAITGYTFNFGEPFNPTIITSTLANFQPTFHYSNSAPGSQNFTILCIAQNNAGCIDSLKKVITVNNPFPNFTTSSPYACIPKGGVSTLTFNAASGFVSYSITYGGTPAVWQNLTSYNNVPHQYSIPGIYTASLMVTDNGGCKSTQQIQINANGQPTASAVFSGSESGVYCDLATPTVISTSSINITPITHYIWTIGNITSPVTTQTVLSTNINSLGVTVLSLQVSIYGACASNYSLPIYVFPKPKATFTLNKYKFCLGDTIKVSIKDTTGNGVASWLWFFGDAVPQNTIYAGTVAANLTQTLSYLYNTFPSNANGKTKVSLITFAQLPQCKAAIDTAIEVIRVKPDFISSTGSYSHCLGITDNFLDKTPNLNQYTYLYSWNVGTNTTLVNQNPSYIYTASGVYNVNLLVTEKDYKCFGNTAKTITVIPVPKAFINVGDTVCPNTTFTVSGSAQPGVAGGQVKGAVNYNSKQDSVKFNSNNIFSYTTSALASTTYSLIVTDNNGCVSKPGIDSVYIQPKLPPLNWDTTVIIGELIPLNAYSGKNYSYTWTPVVKDLDCINCYNPISNSTVNITYSVLIEDKPMACFVTQNIYSITVNPKTSIDVPTAFTPNGDGVNDRVYVGGWGIRKLLYFKIFNRWGQLMFETNDLKSGWDGFYEGIPQNMETYVYEAAVETWLDTKLTKSGTVKIIR
jgi:gliding motility-associated-like protein